MDELSAESGQCLAGYYCNGSSTLQNPVNETFGDRAENSVPAIQ
jgi:hypothetical protein